VHDPVSQQATPEGGKDMSVTDDHDDLEQLCEIITNAIDDPRRPVVDLDRSSPSGQIYEPSTSSHLVSNGFHLKADINGRLRWYEVRIRIVTDAEEIALCEAILDGG
jgi:hypothetical protein